MTVYISALETVRGNYDHFEKDGDNCNRNFFMTKKDDTGNEEANGVKAVGNVGNSFMMTMVI